MLNQNCMKKLLGLFSQKRKNEPIEVRGWRRLKIPVPYEGKLMLSNNWDSTQQLNPVFNNFLVWIWEDCWSLCTESRRIFSDECQQKYPCIDLKIKDYDWKDCRLLQEFNHNIAHRVHIESSGWLFIFIKRQEIR